MSQTFLLEPDIIAAAENVMPDLNNDLVLAKNFLKQQCAATGDTLLVNKPFNQPKTFQHFSLTWLRNKNRTELKYSIAPRVVGLIPILHKHYSSVISFGFPISRRSPEKFLINSTEYTGFLHTDTTTSWT